MKKLVKIIRICDVFSSYQKKGRNLISIKKPCECYTFQNGKPIQISKFLVEIPYNAQIGNTREKNNFGIKVIDGKRHFSLFLFLVTLNFFSFLKKFVSISSTKREKKGEEDLSKIEFSFFQSFHYAKSSRSFKKV